MNNLILGKTGAQGEGTKSEDVSFFDKKYIIFNFSLFVEKKYGNVRWNRAEHFVYVAIGALGDELTFKINVNNFIISIKIHN